MFLHGFPFLGLLSYTGTWLSFRPYLRSLRKVRRLEHAVDKDCALGAECAQPIIQKMAANIYSLHLLSIVGLFHLLFLSQLIAFVLRHGNQNRH